MKMHQSFLMKIFLFDKTFSVLNFEYDWEGDWSKKGACLALSRPFLGNSPPFLLLR